MNTLVLQPKEVQTATIEPAETQAGIHNSDAGPGVRRFRDLLIDMQERRVSRSGIAIHLTPREYAILEILAEHRGQVVTRFMIWQRLYHEPERYASNVVDVYIRYLRRKIDNGFSPSLILTVWGQGYKLRSDEDASTP